MATTDPYNKKRKVPAVPSATTRTNSSTSSSVVPQHGVVRGKDGARPSQVLPAIPSRTESNEDEGDDKRNDEDGDDGGSGRDDDHERDRDDDGSKQDDRAMVIREGKGHENTNTRKAANGNDEVPIAKKARRETGNDVVASAGDTAITATVTGTAPVKDVNETEKQDRKSMSTILANVPALLRTTAADMAGKAQPVSITSLTSLPSSASHIAPTITTAAAKSGVDTATSPSGDIDTDTDSEAKDNQYIVSAGKQFSMLPTLASPSSLMAAVASNGGSPAGSTRSTAVGPTSIPGTSYIPWIVWNAAKQSWTVTREAIEFLDTLPDFLEVLSAFGKSRSGKSTLIGALMRRSKVFPISDSSSACTKGIYLATVTEQVSDRRVQANCRRLWVDTEGWNAVNANVQMDIDILVMIMILSSSVILNVMRTMDRSIVDTLKDVLAAASNMQVTPGRTVSMMDSKERQEFMPRFMCVIQSSTLQLVSSKDGVSTLTAQQYFESEVLDKHADLKRAMYESFGQHSECRTLPPPCENEAHYRFVDQDAGCEVMRQPPKYTTTRWHDAIHALRNNLDDHVRVKCMQGNMITGPMLARLSKFVVTRLNEQSKMVHGERPHMSMNIYDSTPLLKKLILSSTVRRYIKDAIVIFDNVYRRLCEADQQAGAPKFVRDMAQKQYQQQLQQQQQQNRQKSANGGGLPMLAPARRKLPIAPGAANVFTLYQSLVIEWHAIQTSMLRDIAVSHKASLVKQDTVPVATTMTMSSSVSSLTKSFPDMSKEPWYEAVTSEWDIEIGDHIRRIWLTNRQAHAKWLRVMLIDCVETTFQTFESNIGAAMAAHVATAITSPPPSLPAVTAADTSMTTVTVTGATVASGTTPANPPQPALLHAGVTPPTPSLPHATLSTTTSATSITMAATSTKLSTSILTIPRIDEMIASAIQEWNTRYFSRHEIKTVVPDWFTNPARHIYFPVWKCPSTNLAITATTTAHSVGIVGHNNSNYSNNNNNNDGETLLIQYNGAAGEGVVLPLDMYTTERIRTNLVKLVSTSSLDLWVEHQRRKLADQVLSSELLSKWMSKYGTALSKIVDQYTTRLRTLETNLAVLQHKTDSERKQHTSMDEEHQKEAMKHAEALLKMSQDMSQKQLEWEKKLTSIANQHRTALAEWEEKMRAVEESRDIALTKQKQALDDGARRKKEASVESARLTAELQNAESVSKSFKVQLDQQIVQCDQAQQSRDQISADLESERNRIAEFETRERKHMATLNELLRERDELRKKVEQISVKLDHETSQRATSDARGVELQSNMLTLSTSLESIKASQKQAVAEWHARQETKIKECTDLQGRVNALDQQIHELRESHTRERAMDRNHSDRALRTSADELDRAKKELVEARETSDALNKRVIQQSDAIRDYKLEAQKYSLLSPQLESLKRMNSGLSDQITKLKRQLQQYQLQGQQHTPTLPSVGAYGMTSSMVKHHMLGKPAGQQLPRTSATIRAPSTSARRLLTVPSLSHPTSTAVMTTTTSTPLSPGISAEEETTDATLSETGMAESTMGGQEDDIGSITEDRLDANHYPVDGEDHTGIAEY